jgi:hypothetical protein
MTFLLSQFFDALTTFKVVGFEIFAIFGIVKTFLKSWYLWNFSIFRVFTIFEYRLQKML